ncbi:hypothetical protein [Gulosibacter molinativorax]|nr:hypothetical protein [Gulosibacter molinativorax]
MDALLAARVSVADAVVGALGQVADASHGSDALAPDPRRVA